jgi:hypothetical protein
MSIEFVPIDRTVLKKLKAQLELGGPEWERSDLIAALGSAIEHPGIGPVAELTESQFMASVGRHASSISETRPLGMQWEQIFGLFRRIAGERYWLVKGVAQA